VLLELGGEERSVFSKVSVMNIHSYALNCSVFSIHSLVSSLLKWLHQKQVYLGVVSIQGPRT